jgi:hypothetical protein
MKEASNLNSVINAIKRPLKAESSGSIPDDATKPSSDEGYGLQPVRKCIHKVRLSYLS